jgi:hypothetical protein
MTPQYSWQLTERQPTPLHDLPDSDFEMRLERLALQLDGLCRGEEPCREESISAITSAARASIALPSKSLT